MLTHQNRISVTNWYVRGDYRRSFGVKTEARLFAAYSEGEPTADDHLDVGSPRFWIRRELGVRSVDTGAEVHLRAREDLRFVGGLDYTTDDQQLQNNILVFKDGSGERYQTPSTILGKKRFNNLGVFLQGVSGLGDKLEVTAGGRLDSHNIYGEDFNWRLAAVYGPASAVHVKLLAAASFKAPTPRELYDVSGTSRGNPGLRPQKARTFEAGVEALSGSFGGSLNVFHNHLTDIIKLVTPAKAEPGVQKSYARQTGVKEAGCGRLPPCVHRRRLQVAQPKEPEPHVRFFKERWPATTSVYSMAHDDPLRIPEPLRHDVEQIFGLTDPFCAEYLDGEYGGLVRKLIAKLARKRPSPLVRGDLRIWAAAAIYAVGSVNFLFDRTQRPHLTGDGLSALTGVPKSTLASKAKLIRDVLRLAQMDPEFCRQELLASNPRAWMISVDGFIVDARTMPPEVQAEARRRGLVPDLPGPVGKDRGGTAGGGEQR